MCIYFYCKIFLNGFNAFLFKIIGYEQHMLFLHDLHVLLKNSYKGRNVTFNSFFKCNEIFINTKSIK